ncbi:hypothetical protein LEMLEM_LOCUS20969, partial [Lemmus lemmus]
MRLGLLSQQENSETFTPDGCHGPSGEQLALSMRQQNKDSIAGVSVLESITATESNVGQGHSRETCPASQKTWDPTLSRQASHAHVHHPLPRAFGGAGASIMPVGNNG